MWPLYKIIHGNFRFKHWLLAILSWILIIILYVMILYENYVRSFAVLFVFSHWKLFYFIRNDIVVMSETNKIYNSICECFSKSDAKRIQIACHVFKNIHRGIPLILEFLWKYANCEIKNFLMKYYLQLVKFMMFCLF